MLHFFSEVERSEEEKGGGGFNVSPQIRQIDQFTPPYPHGPDYPGEAALPPFQMRAQPVPALPSYPFPVPPIKKAAEAFTPAAALACLAFQKGIDFFADLMRLLAKELQALMRRCAQGLSPSLISMFSIS